MPFIRSRITSKSPDPYHLKQSEGVSPIAGSVVQRLHHSRGGRNTHIHTWSPIRIRFSTSFSLAELNAPTFSTRASCDEVRTHVQLIFPGLGSATRTTRPGSPRSTSTANPEMSSLAGSTATTHRRSPLSNPESTTTGRSSSKATVQISPRLTILSVRRVEATARFYEQLPEWQSPGQQPKLR